MDTVDSTFNAADVKRRADIALAAHQNIPDEARKIYLAEIMDWTDYYTENFSNTSENEKSIESCNVLNSIVTLWIEFATMEKNLRQWKRAIQVFDDALNDVTASKSSTLYIAYANYCKERNKPASAQKVYLRGLSANLDQKESDLIWKEYLETMRKSGSKELTMEQLYGALLKQVESKNISKPSLEAIEQSKLEQQAKRAAILEEKQQSLKVNDTTTAAAQQVNMKNEGISSQPIVQITSHKVDSAGPREDALAVVENVTVVVEPVKQTAPKSQSADERQLLSLTDLDDLSGYSTEKLLAIFSTHPPMLFSAPHIEPMVAGLNILSLTEIKELENYFGTSLAVAEAAALGVGVRERETDSKLELLLDVLETLWTTQAMKERHFDAWFAALTRSQRDEEYDLRTTHGKKVNWPAFRKRCATQREILCAIVNKILFTLLIDQISVISDLDMPYFEPSTLLKLQQWPSIREKALLLVGTDLPTTSNIVEGQEMPLPDNQEKLKVLDSELMTEIGRQSNIVCSLLSFRLRQSSMMITPPDLVPHSEDTATPSAPSSAAALYRAALASQNSVSSHPVSPHAANIPTSSKRPLAYVEEGGGGSAGGGGPYRSSSSSSSSSTTSRYENPNLDYSQLFDHDKQKRKFKRRRYEPINGGGSVNRSWSIKDSPKSVESKEMDVDPPPASRPSRSSTSSTTTDSKSTTAATKSVKSLVATSTSTAVPTASPDEVVVKRTTKKSEPKKAANVTPLEVAPAAPDLQNQTLQQSAAPVVLKESSTLPLLEKLAAMLKKAKETKKDIV